MSRVCYYFPGFFTFGHVKAAWTQDVYTDRARCDSFHAV